MTKEIIDNNDPYKSAGVDIEAGNNLVDKIKDEVASSHGPNVLGNIGGFAGMFKLDKDYENPVLVACTDGVGTKVALAQETKNLGYIGQDLVAMCVNDLIVCGAKPLFFLDYFASSKLDVEEAAVIIKSIAKACRDSGCALLGGETAEMPGHYVGNNFDLAGFSVGCVDEKNILTNKLIDSGNILIGIESSGPHSNGFSLIRKIINESNLNNEEFLKIINDGIDLIPYLAAISLLESTSILQTFIVSDFSEATSATVGASCLHGPHHSAQKSTKTGISEFKTSLLKFSSSRISITLLIY